MEKENGKVSSQSRRNFITRASIFLAGGMVGSTGLALSSTRKGNEPPPLPWKWAKLDPLEAGRRAYRGYLTKPGG